MSGTVPFFERSIPLSPDPLSCEVPERETFRHFIRAGTEKPAHRLSVLEDGERQCTYGEIVPAIEAIERTVHAAGLESGDCVVVELSNSVCSALLLLALLDAGYSLIITPAPGLGARSGREAAPAVRFAKAIVAERPISPQCPVHLAEPSTYVEVRANATYDPASRVPDKARPCIFTRTSGSLGDAKIVKRTYAAHERNLRNVAGRLPYDPSVRLAVPTPIYHFFGLGSGFLVALHRGVSLDLQPRANVLRFLERERQFQPNAALVVPTLCEMLVRVRRAPRPYRFMIVGGDTLSDTLRARSEALHGPLINAYSSTETGTLAMSELSASRESSQNFRGRLMPGVTLRVLAPSVPANDRTPIGELQVKTAFMFEEYVDVSGHRREVATSFDGDWYRTGDLVRIIDGDRLEVLGRCDLCVNRNGLLLPFADVEARLRNIEGVEAAAVVAGPPGIRGRSLIAFCVLSSTATITPLEVRARYATDAPPYSVPDAVRILNALPLLPSGKVDRQALMRSAHTLLSAVVCDSEADASV